MTIKATYKKDAYFLPVVGDILTPAQISAHLATGVWEVAKKNCGECWINVTDFNGSFFCSRNGQNIHHFALVPVFGVKDCPKAWFVYRTAF